MPRNDKRISGVRLRHIDARTWSCIMSAHRRLVAAQTRTEPLTVSKPSAQELATAEQAWVNYEHALTAYYEGAKYAKLKGTNVNAVAKFQRARHWARRAVRRGAA